MAGPRPGSSDRLDSWKAIAAHLGRDVRTVRRWELKNGLPVRRVPGRRGQSVFAYACEIDAWLTATPPRPEDGGSAPVPSRQRGVQWAIGALVVLLVGIAGVAWGVHQPPLDVQNLTFRLHSGTVVALAASGQERWRLALPPDERIGGIVEHAGAGPVTPLQNGGGFVFAVGRFRQTDGMPLPSEILRFTPRGEPLRAFAFERRVKFGKAEYTGWSITDYRVLEHDGRRQVAVSAHHYQWWPSLVTVLDDNWEPQGTFVNAGWIEALFWLTPNRLVIAGFSNARDGGVVALLDTTQMDGSSPAWDDATFQCTSCGGASPLRYVVFPRSELNRVTGSPFNRVRLTVEGDRMVAHTIEVPGDEGMTDTDAIFELTPALDVVRASYSDRYWDLHQALHNQGKIRHSRAACPDRDGPPAVEVWDRRGGWQTVTLRGTR